MNDFRWDTYAVRWTEFDRNDRLIVKSKEFKTEEQRAIFIVKRENSGALIEVLEYSDPQ